MYRIFSCAEIIGFEKFAHTTWENQPRPQGLLLDHFQNGGSSIRHFENRRGEGSGDEVVGK